jgi:glutathione S-transferase
MITLYHCANARSFRVLWMLEELGAPYRLEMLPFPPRVLHREYLQINPQGTVPLLIDGETRMTESAAICQYLASLHAPTPLNVAPAEAGYGAYLDWLHFGEASLTFPLTLVLRYALLEPEDRRQPQAAEDYAQFFSGRLRTLGRAIHGGRHLGRLRLAAGQRAGPMGAPGSGGAAILGAPEFARGLRACDGGTGRSGRAAGSSAVADGRRGPREAAAGTGLGYAVRHPWTTGAGADGLQALPCMAHRMHGRRCEDDSMHRASSSDPLVSP